MADDTLRLARLSGAAADGETVRFTIEAKDGGKLEIACGHRDIEPVIHFMIGLGRLSAEKRGDVTPHRFGHSDRVEVSPVDISDIGLMREIDGDSAVLALRMFGFDLGFQVDPPQLKALHAEIERILPASMLRPSDHHDHGHDHDH